jgi:hypothetical protein
VPLLTSLKGCMKLPMVEDELIADLIDVTRLQSA